MISLKKYEDLPINTHEILRYMGCSTQQDKQVLKLTEDCLNELGKALTYKVCFDEFPVKCSANTVEFPFAKADSSALYKCLQGFSRAVIFGATIGFEIDRLILKYSRLSPSRALCFQAIGAERIEALCNAFCGDLSDEQQRISPRFSPGYGDLSLSFQTEIFKVLDLPRKIGVSLNSALLMSPSKSVTAIIGTD